MLRASACFLFIVVIFSIAAGVAYLAMQATGSSNLPAYLVGIAVFALILTVAVMLLATMNDRLNK